MSDLNSPMEDSTNPIKPSVATDEGQAPAAVAVEIMSEVAPAGNESSPKMPDEKVQVDDTTEAKEDAEGARAEPVARRGDENFTSEIYKIMVEGIPSYIGVAQLRKLLGKHGLKAVKIKKGRDWDYAYMTFESEEVKAKAKAALNGLVLKKSSLSVTDAAALIDPYQANQAKRSAESSGGGRKKIRFNDDGKSAGTEGGSENWEVLNDHIVKLWRLPYTEQLRLKQEMCIEHMTCLTKELKGHALPWLAEVADSAPACPVLDIEPSPQPIGYRNNCQFTVGSDGAVGNVLGLYKEGVTAVVAPTNCPHVSQQMKDIAAVTEKFIKQSSLAPYDRVAKTGHWRLLCVRSNQAGQAMVILQMHPQQLPANEIEETRSNVKLYFSQQTDVVIASMYFQAYSGKTNGLFGTEPIEHLFGETVIVEELLGLQFRISPLSFFQVNTPGAQVLYEAIRDWCSALLTSDNEDSQSDKPVVIDLCCGTGTIGMVLSKVASEVVGVEVNASAVEDAKKNSAANGINNTRYCLGPAEKVLYPEIKKLSTGHVVAVADPSRNGLQSSVIRALRSAPGLSHVIYVACDPRQAMQNMVSLCKPSSRNMPGEPFQPIKAMGVDLFPQTDKVELMVLFARG